MKSLILIILLLNIVYSVVAQTYLSYNKYMDIPKAGYYSKSLVCSDTSGNNTWVVLQIDSTSSKKYQHIIRLDIDGNVLFSKELYTQGYTNSIIATQDDGLLMIGSIQKGAKWAGWACKLNSIGDIQWNCRYFNTAFDIYCNDAAITSNGDYILYGSQYHSSKYRGLILRISPTGDVVWVREYDNPMLTSSVRTKKVLPLSNGNMMVSFNQGETQSYFIKIDTNGDILHQNSYYCNTWNNFILTDFAQLSPNKYAAFFSTISQTSFVVMDSNGVITSSHPSNSLHEKILYIENQYIYTKPSFSYAIMSKIDTLGQMYNYLPSMYGDFSSIAGKNQNNTILVYPRADKKVYFTKLNVRDVSDTTCYGVGNNLPYGLTIIDTNFTVSTTTYTYFREDVSTQSKSITFNFTTICSKTSTSVQDKTQADHFVNLYPNPAQDWLHITCPYTHYEVRIWDMQGKLVEYIPQGKDIPLWNYPQGVYAVQIISRQGNWSGKFVKIQP